GLEAFLLRVGVVDGVSEVVAAQHKHEAVFADGFDEYLDLGEFDPGQLVAHGDAALGGRPSGPAVGDQAGLVQGAEVAANRHVAGADGKVDSQRFEDAAADAVLQRVVAEQPQVPRAAAGGDAGQDRNAQPAHPLADQQVEVGGPGRLQLGFPARVQGQPPQSV